MRDMDMNVTRGPRRRKGYMKASADHAGNSFRAMLFVGLIAVVAIIAVIVITSYKQTDAARQQQLNEKEGNWKKQQERLQGESR